MLTQIQLHLEPTTGNQTATQPWRAQYGRSCRSRPKSTRYEGDPDSNGNGECKVRKAEAHGASGARLVVELWLVPVGTSAGSRPAFHPPAAMVDRETTMLKR